MEHPWMTFFIVIILLTAIEGMFTTFINRKKPTVRCDCSCHEDEEDLEDE